MQLLFLVIKRIELVDEIMRSLAQAGIRGGTVIDSVGMAKSISTMDNLPMIGVLRSILSGEDAAQKGKTIFVAVADDQVFEVNGLKKTYQQTFVTGKGQHFVINLLKKYYGKEVLQ